MAWMAAVVCLQFVETIGIIGGKQVATRRDEGSKQLTTCRQASLVKV